jgi:hypothetical protein
VNMFGGSPPQYAPPVVPNPPDPPPLFGGPGSTTPAQKPGRANAFPSYIGSILGNSGTGTTAMGGATLLGH